jgi:hypothetical protein
MKGGTPLHYHFICILPDDCIHILKYILSHPDFIWNHHNTHEETPMSLAQDLLKLELGREKILYDGEPLWSSDTTYHEKIQTIVLLFKQFATQRRNMVFKVFNFKRNESVMDGI